MSTNYQNLFSPFKLGNVPLSTRVVMAPMTRSRAIDNLPNDSIVTYYRDRASDALIITEGTAPSPNGLGYPRIPGLFNQAQATAWKKVTDAVHEKNGKIFIQLMHTGRVSHPLNLPTGAKVIAPSAIAASATEMYTDAKGMQPLPVPEMMDKAQIKNTIQEYVDSAKLAMTAGFDGVELHGANGYLIDQFLNPASNTRDDNYGGTFENRNRFAIEVATAVAQAIGKDKVGIRISPFGVFNEMISDDNTEAQFVALAKAFKEIGLVYVHIVDHAAMGAPALPANIKDAIKIAFGGTIILSGGYDAPRAEADRKSTRLNSSHSTLSRMPSSA